MALWGTSFLFLSHRLTTVSVFKGKQTAEIENYSEEEKNALHKGIILNHRTTSDVIPLFIIPIIGLYILSELKSKKDPNKTSEPTSLHAVDEPKPQSEVGSS